MDGCGPFIFFFKSGQIRGQLALLLLLLLPLWAAGCIATSFALN